MPLKLSGSTGISGIDGSAAAPSISGANANTGIYYSGGVVYIASNGASSLTISNTSVIFPTGTTAQRPTTSAGALRFNTDSAAFEGYNGSSWGSLGGATGAGSDQVFVLNGLSVNTSYTIPTGKSAMSVGPITIANGVSITVPAGSRHVIL